MHTDPNSEPRCFNQTLAELKPGSHQFCALKQERGSRQSCSAFTPPGKGTAAAMSPPYLAISKLWLHHLLPVGTLRV